MAYRAMINALLALNRSAEATEYYQQVIRYKPDNTDDFLAMAHIHQRLGHNEAAVEAYENALKKARRKVEIERGIYKTYPGLGGCCEADKELATILQEAARSLTALYSKIGNKGKAREYERLLVLPKLPY